MVTRSYSSSNRKYSAAAAAAESQSDSNGLPHHPSRNELQDLQPLQSSRRKAVSVIFPPPTGDISEATSWLDDSVYSTRKEGSAQYMSPFSIHDANVPSPYLAFVAEHVSYIHACLSLGHVKRAEELLKRLADKVSDNKPLLLKMGVDVRVHNAFIAAMVQKDDSEALASAVRWFDDVMKVQWSVQPNAVTFAWMIKAYLRSKNMDNAEYVLRAYASEMQGLDINFEDIIDTRVLEHTEITRFFSLIGQTTPSVASEPDHDVDFLTSKEPDSNTPRSTAADFPEAKAVNSKGINFLRRSLAPLHANVDTDALQRQHALEDSAYDAALNKLKSENQAHRERGADLAAMNLGSLKSYMWEWHEKLQVALSQTFAEAERLDVDDTNSTIKRTRHKTAVSKAKAVAASDDAVDTNSESKKSKTRSHKSAASTAAQPVEGSADAVGVESELHAHIDATNLSRDELATDDVEAISWTELNRPKLPAIMPFLRQLSPKKLAIITILEVLRLSGSGGIAGGLKFARGSLAVGIAVENEIAAERMKRQRANGEQAMSGYERNLDLNALLASGRLFNMAVRRQQAQVDVDGNEWSPAWTQKTRAEIGGYLLSHLVTTAKIPVEVVNQSTGQKSVQNIPAFSHMYQLAKAKKIGIVKIHQRIVDKLMQEPVRDTLHPRLLPMLVNPKPWLAYDNGGYLYSKQFVMRMKDSQEQKVYLRAASEQNLLDTVLSGLDVLGSTPWRINENVLKTVLEVWNSGEGLAEIPPLQSEDDLELPPKPAEAEYDQSVKSAWIAECKELQTQLKNNHSIRCDTNYKVEIARAFVGERMYFPHSMDFRGRAYPITPHLNHLGNDLCRGLLSFYNGKPLGQSGFRWLKIQLANLYGYDKASFSDRENWVMEHLDDIFESADNPMQGKRWWSTATDPWQTLATCHELTAAIRSGDPHSFVSYLPIHQDGTCNGLQHYAALGGDMAGAKQVNLSPSDIPQDVYTGVLDLVIKMVDADAEKGNENALLLKDRLSRKIIKQTVMTNVYGVTFVGARDQIDHQLRDIDAFPPHMVYTLSGYLAKLTFESIGEMFNGARAIQEWLTESAALIARSIPASKLNEEGHLVAETKINGKGTIIRKPVAVQDSQMTSVVWTTPLNLPIVQPYRKVKQKQVMTHLQSVYIADPSAPAPVNQRKQKSAFPPNFIHSLDATHMLMTALECKKQGLDFAAVHDSYWTHACDIDTMAVIIRDQFIELHSQPIMENLKKEFEERYKNYMVPLPISAPPKKQLKGVDAFDKTIRLRQLENAMTSEDDPFADDVTASPDVKELEDRQPRVRRQATYHVNQWTALKFPPLPPKGRFDVRDIKRSQYFFH